MSGFVESVRRGLTRNVAFTAAGSDDPRLQGRTYAVPFDAVWQASRGLVDGGLWGWTLHEDDDQEGILRGSARGRVVRHESSVTVRISLDEDAQTRVDAVSASRTARMDMGSNARRLAAFFRALDAAVAARPGRSQTGG